MLEISVTDEFRERFKALPAPVKKKFGKQLVLFQAYSHHPSLHVEKLNPKDHQIWSFRIDRSYRVLFRFLDGNKALFLTVGHHGWIYRFS
jgi:mRNA-degrading endonuclease RelE of RelBE toxin-antitoxin system